VLPKGTLLLFCRIADNKERTYKKPLRAISMPVMRGERLDYSAAEATANVVLEIAEGFVENFSDDSKLQYDLSVLYEILDGIAKAQNDYKATEG